MKRLLKPLSLRQLEVNRPRLPASLAPDTAEDQNRRRDEPDDCVH